MVVGGTFVVDVTTGVVATGPVVSTLTLHAEATSTAAPATTHFLTVPVCHPLPGGGGVSDALGVDTCSRQAPRTKRSPRRRVPGLVTSA